MEVLFINEPSVYGEREFGMFNFSKAIIEDAGFDVLDLNYYVDEMGLDYSTDFKNYYHVNVWGAMKVTDFLADYCNERYSIPNHSEDSEYVMWEEKYEKFIEQYKQCQR